MKGLQLKNIHFGFMQKGGDAEFGRDPRRDWRLLFSAFLLLNFLSVVFSIYIYARINDGEIFLVEKKETAPVATLDRAQLEKTLALFAEREERRKEFIRKGISSPDPAVSF